MEGSRETRKKVEKYSLRPSIDLTKQLFKVKQQKRETLYEHMYKSIRRSKVIASRYMKKVEFTSPIPRPIKHGEFVDLCEKCPSIEMSRHLEKRIRKRIQARGLEEQHPIVLAELVQQIKEEYSKVIRCACMNLKIKNCYPEYNFIVEPYKNVGKTNRYQEYLQIRKHLKVKWILHYPIVKRILRECVVSLPYELCYLQLDTLLDLIQFQNVLKGKVKLATVTVHEFYHNILLLVDEEQSKHRRKIYSVNYLDACTGLISVHLSRAIAHTILCIISFTKCQQNEPYLSFDVSFNKGLVLKPSSEEVITIYNSFIDDIIRIGTKIYVLQQKERRSYKNTYMPLCLTDEFITDSKQQISLNIQKLYEPILEYLENISKEFEEVYPDIHSELFYDSISDITLEKGHQRINYYKIYLNKAAQIPHNEYFKLGQISLVSYKETIEDGLRRNVDDIFQKLSLQHLWEATNLCETFQLIHTRATQKPLTTEELVETGKFMTWIKNEHLEELSVRVETSLFNLCRIIDLGVLSDDHLELNSAVVHWLDKSLPVIDEYFINFEQLKYDAEEILQKTVEDVTANIKDVYPLLVILDNMDDIARVREYLKSITLHMSKIKEIEGQIFLINKEEVCLSFPKSTYSEFEDLKTYVFPFYHLLKLCLDVQRNLSVWQDGQFENLDHESTKTSVDKIYEELKRLYKTYREKLRRAQDENLPVRFRGTVDDPDILNWPAPLKLCGMAMKLIDEFKPSVEIMTIICNKALRNRHWKAMSEIAGVDITPNAGTTLRKMMKVDFKSRLNDYEIISSGATKEKQLIDSLRNLKQQWDNIRFSTSSYKQAKILVHLEDIEAIIDEHSIKLANMRGSVFVKPHEVEVKEFFTKILRIDQTVEKWGQMQDQFLRLFPIFSTGHLDTIVPKEADIFKRVWNVYNFFMDIIVRVEIVIRIVDTTDILEKIDVCLADLEIILSGVVTYLETVRLDFPRFYFLADDELLEIVSRKEPISSQTFLKKIFQGIQRLEVNNSQIIAMESKYAETLKFLEPIELTTAGKVEELCAQIEKQMVESLKFSIDECCKVYKHLDIKEVLSRFPQQAIHIILQVYWTERLETGLELAHNVKLRLSHKKLQEDLTCNVNIIKENNVSNVDKLKLRALVVAILNYKYVMEKILDSRTVNKDHFDWEAHAKYYLYQGQCTVQMMNVNQSYLYEYLGNFEPIVLTPLTDRCYRTLINAYYLHFNGLVVGSEGSGKSQTIRELAGALAVFFVSFGCLPEVNSPTISRLLKGSSLCGSWVSFENFGVLKSEALSVVSQDIHAILLSKKDFGTHSVGGTSIKVNPTSFVCLTISRKSIERLPENLRVLFRSIIMIQPDTERIIEVTLHCLGFNNAIRLSKKISCFYKMILDILPARKHYNFGFRTLKTTLLGCCVSQENNNEDYIVYLQLRKVFQQMLVGEDIKIFDSFLSDIFPDVSESIEVLKDVTVKEYMTEYCQKNNLQFTEELYVKTLQVYNTLSNASGVILVGDTFTAKTTAIKICEYTFSKIDQKDLVTHVVNPSSLSYEALYGRLDEASNIWYDGVITRVIREFSSDDRECRKLLIFDGTVDDCYIESVNGILDDGDNFFLDSGEVLGLDKSTTIIYETDAICTTSPSTVSRCRIIYMNPGTLSWNSLVKSWLKLCNPPWLQGHQEQILDLLNWMIPPSLTFIKNNCKQLCSPNQINLVNSTIHITQMMLDEAYMGIVRKEEDIKNLWTWIQATLIQAGVMGLGSVLDIDSRHKFDEFYKQLWKGQLNPYPESFEKLEASIPADGVIFDYHFIYKQRGIWKLYQDLLKNEKVVESPYMYEFLVPTVDSLRYKYLLNMNITNNHSVLLIGPSSTGKSLLIEDILINSLNKKVYEMSQVNFSSNTTSRQLQTYILSKLNKRKVGYFTPPSDKKFLLFIDNLNMAPLNGNGTCDALELLRQYLDQNVWYDLTQSHSITIDKVSFVTAMRPIYDSFRKLNRRFLRHFNVFSINEFPEDTVWRIYTTILFNVWKSGGFPSDITNVISLIVSATIRIYNSVVIKFKPTVGQCHYVFNLNTFTKIIKGCSRLKKETYDANKKIHIKLWAHEVLRVFGDRLDDENQNWLLENVKELIIEEFNEEEVDPSIDKALMFSSIHDRNLEEDVRRYDEILDQKNLADIISECLKHYNYYNKEKMDLILFSYAIEKIIKICRVISISPGNVLLLGSSGTGRQSLSRLASYIYNQKIFQPKITDGYGLKEWNRDLKLVLKEAGGLENQCMLLISEDQIIDEIFLQNIEYILMNGDIPDFYDADERQEILELARLAAQGGNRNLDISSSDVFLYFNKRCKENLHLILCLNFGSLKVRLTKHPSLLNCHVIWCEDWPDHSLQSIAEIRMENFTLDEELKEKVIHSFVYFHRYSQNLAKETAANSKLQVHITSTAYLHLIKLFIRLFTNKQFEIISRKKRYAQGLAKLSYTANQILNMQKALDNYQPQLEEMTQKATTMSEQIALETTEVEKASDLVRRDEAIACEQAAVAQVLKSECEAELAQAIPILEDAISALNTLKPSDITLVKSMKNPPDAIKLVMAAVCVIKDIRPDRLPDPSTGRKILDYWGPSKRILGDMNFLQSLKDFDKDNIKDELMIKIRKEYLPHKDFKPQVVAKASSAAEGLCKWIIAMNMYDMVAKEVAPKKEKLEKAEKEYAETMEVLNGKKGEVARLEGKLAKLNDLLMEAKKKQVKLQKEVDYCNRKLGSAQKLIGSLSEERERWTEASDDLERNYYLLAGDMLMCSGIIAYLSPFKDTERIIAINTWLQYIRKVDIPFTEDFDLVKIFAIESKFDPLQIGLPTDNVFLTNLVIKEISQYYTIFIDPQYRVSVWIQQIEKRNHLTIVEFCDDYLVNLKNCIISGKPILIHKIKEFVPPCVYQLLGKRIYDEGEESVVEIDGEQIKLNDNFRIYMVSNLEFPVFEPAVYKRLAIVNSSLTINGLGDQLLDTVSEVEKPELKKMKKELNTQTITNTSELLELEEKILTILCESDSDILEDEASIRILDQSKDLARIIRMKQEETNVLECTINTFRSAYSSIGEYAAFLFFFINDLKKISTIYEFSLEWYTDLYFKSILNSKRSKQIHERCENIKSSFTYDIFFYVTMSLFEKDKLTFLFLFTAKVLLFSKKICQQELMFFLKCKSVVKTQNIHKNEEILENLRQVEESLQCEGLVQHFVSKTSSWTQFLEKECVGLQDFPTPWNDRLDNLKKLVLVKLLRTDQLIINIKEFIRYGLGETFIKVHHYSLLDIYNESYNLSPVLIFENSGLNSMRAVENLAAEKNILNKFTWLSLATSQISSANDLIEEGRRRGSFIFFQNCHLVPNWLKALSKKIVEMDVDNTHEDFRLWLTANASDNIPMELLQVSIKIVNENPTGLKQNLIGVYGKKPLTDPDFYSGCPGKQKIFSRLLYGVSFFHCLLEEKRKFGAFNWNPVYLFEEEDLRIALNQLQLIINEENFDAEHLEKLNYIIGQCHYSGNVDNEWDIRMVSAWQDTCINMQICNSRNYSFNEVKTYGLPSKNDYKDYLRYISRLPDDDIPQLYGLNEFSFAFSSAKKYKDLMISSIKILEEKFGKELKENHYLLQNIDTILENLPDKVDTSVELEDYVVANEIKHYNNLLFVMRSSLGNLRKGVIGDSELSFDLNQISESILNNSFPKIWLNYSYPHQLNLSSYLEDLDQRVKYFQSIKKLSGKRFWLSAFFYPRSLFCKITLDISRKSGIALENLNLEYEVLTDVEPDANDILIDGLFSIGAKWDKYRDTLVEITSAVCDSFPPILIKGACRLKEETKYECPIFQTVNRFDYDEFIHGSKYFITSILLPSKIDPSHWIKRGVKLVCQAYKEDLS